MTTAPPSAAPAPHDPPLPVAELVAARLAGAPLGEAVKTLLKEALGDGAAPNTSPVGRVYLHSVAVAGFRGIGPRTRLNLTPRPGVTLVVGRNGSGKSSVAEGLETAFTGVNLRWQGQEALRGSNWRNLHEGARPEIEVKLAIEGDAGRSTLTRSWKGDDFSDSEGELRRPGHGRVPLDQVDWKQSLTDYRPFLSYVDLDRTKKTSACQPWTASLLPSLVRLTCMLLESHTGKRREVTSTVPAPRLRRVLLLTLMERLNRTMLLVKWAGFWSPLAIRVGGRSTYMDTASAAVHARWEMSRSATRRNDGRAWPGGDHETRNGPLAATFVTARGPFRRYHCVGHRRNALVRGFIEPQ